MKYWFVIFHLLGFSAEASCISELNRQIATDLRVRNQKYQKSDLEFKGIAAINRPLLKVGSKPEAVFIVHGFMGSPDEMKTVAAAIAQKGPTVYLGLMPGFGGTATIANQVKKSELVRWYQQEVKKLSLCFSKIHLVGFSTGALLAHDYISTHPRDAKIKSVALISPYFTPHSYYSAFLQTVSRYTTNTIDVDSLYRLTGFADIRVMTLKPHAYLAAVPLISGEEIRDLGSDNIAKRLTRKLEIPTLAFISDADRVLNQHYSQQRVIETFQNLEFIRIAVAKKIPHHMMSPLVSPIASQVAYKIRDFIETH